MRRRTAYPNRIGTLALTLGACLNGFCLFGSANDRPAAVDLRYGGTLPGQVSSFPTKNDDDKLIQVSPQLILAVPGVEVRRVKEADEAMNEYQRLLAKMPQTAEANWELSRWCNEKRLSAQRDRHLHRAIELDPNHGPARQLLGYEPDGNNGWVSSEALRRERGLVREGGKWQYAEEVLSQHDTDQSTSNRKEWIRKISSLKKLVMRGGPKSAEAMQELQNIDDPYADEAVTAEFLDVTDRALFPRHMWLDILGRLRTPISVSTIVNAALVDSSQSIRERCYELLNEYGKYQAVPFFVSKLRSKDNAEIRAAARALSYVNDPEIAMELVDALVTKHQYEVGPANDMNVSMSRDGTGGMGGLGMGGGKKVVNRDERNTEVLSALLEIVEDDVNYQFDQKAWRIYFAKKYAGTFRDLRRDP